ncbi:hypothetical protein ADUPG1_014058, partial [Aduncisulcus paluster]
KEGKEGHEEGDTREEIGVEKYVKTSKRKKKSKKHKPKVLSPIKSEELE